MDADSLNKTIQLAGLAKESVVDGSGIRFCIFTQGCPHRCEGCHNPETHSYEGGQTTKIADLAQMILANPLLDGITLSGGEPFVFAEPLALLASFVHKNGMNVWCYSGYTLEQLVELAKTDKAVSSLLDEIDVLVDGKYEQDKQNLLLKFRGSSNQRLIDMNQTRKQNKLVLLD